MLNKSDIFAPLQQVAIDQLPSLLMSLRLIEKVDVFPPPTEEEEKLQWVLHFTQPLDILQSKEQYKFRTLRRGFEELYLSIRETLGLMWIFWKKKADDPDSIDELAVRAGHLKFPKLINEIEIISGKKFLHKNELNSLNNARNCLTHASGVINEGYCNNIEKDKLIIHASKMLLFYQNNEIKIPVEIGKPSPPNSALMLGAERFHIEYPIGSTIQLSLREFIDIFLTIYIFIKSDIELMLD